MLSLYTLLSTARGRNLGLRFQGRCYRFPEMFRVEIHPWVPRRIRYCKSRPRGLVGGMGVLHIMGRAVYSVDLYVCIAALCDWGE